MSAARSTNELGAPGKHLLLCRRAESRGKVAMVIQHGRKTRRVRIKDIDAVIIASPDHWHKQMLIDAVDAGKDVYVEKPATHLLEEGPAMIRAVEKSGRIVQTGTQHRSWKHYIQAKEIVDSGALGTVRMVESYWYLNYAPAL